MRLYYTQQGNIYNSTLCCLVYSNPLIQFFFGSYLCVVRDMLSLLVPTFSFINSIFISGCI
ncbi:hypothetical protein BD770DRAFT_377331 [Pilaira anomala]|nr:hypothetical protein BD770DRAFT_377331 [Pilaira anomala]